MSCQETFGADRPRPQVTEVFPEQGLAGYTLRLELEIHHLPKETVLPAGVDFRADSAEAQALTAAQFQLLHRDSTAKPQIERRDAGEQAITQVSLPFLALPREPGRQELTLPSLPIAIARASGQVDTLCTTPHTIRVEDPLASLPADQAELQPDPAPRPQREIWTTARDVTLGLLLALPIALLLAWALYRLWPHLKKKPTPPPPQPAWEVALHTLTQLEQAGLLERADFQTFHDQLTDALRQYLGDRYGAGGLEATTRETLRLLQERAPDFAFEQEVRQLLQRADLVKFARLIPDESECRAAFAETRRIIQKTIPGPSLDPRPPVGTAASTSAPSREGT